MMKSLIIVASLFIATAVFAQAAPGCLTIISVTPSAGPPGTPVVITGSGFAFCCAFECPLADVTFDDAATQVVSWTDVRLVVIAPGHGHGPASVTVRQVGGAAATAANAFTFVVPGVPALGAITAGMAIVSLVAVALMRLR